jgi:CubicO group peptidase (beta-lactamase class C family)
MTIKARRHLALAAFLLGTHALVAGEAWPDRAWPQVAAHEVGLDEAKLALARGYALTAGGAGCITRNGKLVLAWGDRRQRFDLKSSTKSFGSIALGLAIGDGKLTLNDQARRFHPSLGVPPETNAASGWLDEITILHLASLRAGFQ